MHKAKYKKQMKRTPRDETALRGEHVPADNRFLVENHFLARHRKKQHGGAPENFRSAKLRQIPPSAVKPP